MTMDKPKPAGKTPMMASLEKARVMRGAPVDDQTTNLGVMVATGGRT